MSLHHSQGGAGISTCCPSPTTSVLGLGPDLPWADEPSPGNLRLSTGMFLACLSLLIPAFSLEYSPHVLSIVLQPVFNAPLPLPVIISIFSVTLSLKKASARTSCEGENRDDNRQSYASVSRLSPGTSSAHDHSTSELLRTL